MMNCYITPEDLELYGCEEQRNKIEYYYTQSRLEDKVYISGDTILHLDFEEEE